MIELCAPIADETDTVLWETWPDQESIYADPFNAPQWPTAAPINAQLHPSTQQDIRMGASHNPGISSHFETVRNNRAAFEYIVDHELWFQEGVLAQAGKPDGIDFPQNAISVKARWLPIDKSQKNSFFSREFEYQGKSQLFGLVGFHTASKVIPNWHWATFEHVDNKGFADYIGQHDAFGQEEPIVYPNPSPNQGYTPSKLKSSLIDLMENAGLSKVWKNYRLKGTQSDFNDKTGRPTLLGHSITEAGFVATSSCITCHGRATIAPVYNAPRTEKRSRDPQSLQQSKPKFHRPTILIAKNNFRIIQSNSF